MSKRKHIVATFFATAISIPLFMSCVDDSYDLDKDIDMTVTIGGNLSVPGSYTEEFTLGQILDLDEETVIQTDELTGEYRIEKDNETSTSVHINGVVIEQIQSTPKSNHIAFPVPIPDVELTTDIDIPTFDFTLDNNEVTGDIRSLSAIEVNTSATLTLMVNTHGSNELTLKEGFAIEFAMAGQEAPDNLIFDIAEEGKEDFEVQEQTIVFKKDQAIGTATPLSIPLHFMGMGNFPDGLGLTPAPDRTQDGNLHIVVEGKAKGTVALTTHASEALSIELLSNIEFDYAPGQPAVVLESVTGKFDPDVDINIDPVAITGIPDYFTQEENVFDLYNPYILLEQSNPSPLDINLNARVGKKINNKETFSFMLGRPIESSDEAHKITLYGENTTTYYLSRRAMDVRNDAEHIYNDVLGDDLYELISPIPDEISLTEVDAKSLLNECTLNLGKDGADFIFNTKYSLIAPLQFGEETHIVYTDTINDWASDIEDITFTKAIIELDALNGIPMNFKIDASPIDIHGKAYNNVTVNPVQNEIKSGYKILNGDSHITESKIILEIISNGESLENFDGLIVTFTADSKNNEYPNITLNKDMVVQLKNIRIKIIDGITVDLN